MVTSEPILVTAFLEKQTATKSYRHTYILIDTAQLVDRFSMGRVYFQYKKCVVISFVFIQLIKKITVRNSEDPDETLHYIFMSKW